MPKKILLADDSITIQKVIGLTFANEDIELTVVDNGDDAIIKAKEMKPDLIIADVVMPGRDGYEVCYSTKNDPELQSIPVLLLTGTFETFDEAMATKVGANDHITKPFESQALIDKVNELIGNAEAAPAGPSMADLDTPTEEPALLEEEEAVEPMELDDLDPVEEDPMEEFADMEADAAESSFADVDLEETEPVEESGLELEPELTPEDDFSSVGEDLAPAAESSDTEPEEEMSLTDKPAPAPQAPARADDWDVSEFSDYMAADGTPGADAPAAAEEQPEDDFGSEMIEEPQELEQFESGDEPIEELGEELSEEAPVAEFGAADEDLSVSTEQTDLADDFGGELSAAEPEPADLFDDELPVAAEEPEQADDSLNADLPVTAEEPELADDSFDADLPVTAEEPELADDSFDADLPVTAEEPEQADDSLEADLPVTAEEPEPADTFDEDQPVAAEESESIAADNSGNFIGEPAEEPAAAGDVSSEAEPQSSLNEVADLYSLDDEAEQAPAPKAAEPELAGAPANVSTQAIVDAVGNEIEHRVRAALENDGLLEALGDQLGALIETKVTEAIQKVAPEAIDTMVRKALAQATERILSETLGKLRDQ